MFDDDDQSMEDDAPIPDPDPRAIALINDWLDEVTDYGTDTAVIRGTEFTAGQLARYAGCSTPEASDALQAYRRYNYWMDDRCLYVIAHEGHYGANAPWRIQGTRHDVDEAVRRFYRLNSTRHMTWDFYDHAKKQVVSFGAEIRQAVVLVDATTGTKAAKRQRLAVRDYARDLLQNLEAQAQTRAQVILDALNVPKAMRKEYLKYFYDGFWPYVEIMVDEEVEILESMIAS